MTEEYFYLRRICEQLPCSRRLSRVYCRIWSVTKGGPPLLKCLFHLRSVPLNIKYRRPYSVH